MTTLRNSGTTARRSSDRRRIGAVARRPAFVHLVVVAATSALFSRQSHLAVAASGSEKAQQNLEEFWSAFREAVRTNNRSAIVRMANFPFIVRWGNADPNDPSVDYDRTKFEARVGRLLSLKVN